MATLELINNEINTEIAKQDVQKALLATTFKGLTFNSMKQALMEGMMRGYKFKDFLEKNVYAIPFRDGYSLITSVDYARKVGMKSGIVGVSAPTYETDGEKIISCTVTVKRKIDSYIGEYTATVYFAEYYKGGYNGKPSLWDTKPRTMIAKVAEMHALRKACPEELAQAYVEEEMQKETVVIPLKQEITDEIRKKVLDTTSEEALKAVWEEHKGLGKDFAKLVVEHKKFIKDANKDA